MLECIGSIERDEDPTISVSTWQEVIGAFKLRPIESCEILNPFTKERETLNAPLELAALVIGEQCVGVVRWCSRGQGFDIIGEPGAMTPLAEAIAERIGGRIRPSLTRAAAFDRFAPGHCSPGARISASAPSGVSLERADGLVATSGLVARSYAKWLVASRYDA